MMMMILMAKNEWMIEWWIKQWIWKKIFRMKKSKSKKKRMFLLSWAYEQLSMQSIVNPFDLHTRTYIIYTERINHSTDQPTNQTTKQLWWWRPCICCCWSTHRHYIKTIFFIILFLLRSEDEKKNKEKKDNYNRLAKNKIRNKHTHSHIYTA